MWVIAMPMVFSSVRTLFRFGEIVPKMEKAIQLASEAEIFLIIGTSMQVYPAAGLIDYVPANCEIFVINPNLENSYPKSAELF